MNISILNEFNKYINKVKGIGYVAYSIENLKRFKKLYPLIELQNSLRR